MEINDVPDTNWPTEEEDPKDGRPEECGDLDRCPMPCEHCEQPGDCEDCLDCLRWPRPVDDEPVRPPPEHWASLPLLTQELEAARAGLTPATRVGLVMRRCRKERRLSQRALAEGLGWSPSAVGRAEVDARRLTIESLEHVLAFTGHRLAIVPDTAGPAEELGEDPDSTWGVPEVVARDIAGRRLPPYGRALFRAEPDRIQDEGLVGHRQPWVWQQPR